MADPRPPITDRFGPGSSRWEPEPEKLGLITPVPLGAHPTGCRCPGCCLRRELDAAGALPAAPKSPSTQRESPGAEGSR